MTETTHTMAGLLAVAGAARLRAAAPLASYLGAAPVATIGATPQHQVFGNHPSAIWTKGRLAKTTTFMVLDRKNRPARPLSELSP